MSKAKLRIQGRVQGVFYRQTTREKALNLRLTGWVRNVTDGSVEAEVSGPHDKVEALIEWCRQGPSAAQVKSVEVDWIDFTDNSDGTPGQFDIR